MEKEDIRVTHVIIHILDSTVGTAVMSGALWSTVPIFPIL